MKKQKPQRATKAAAARAIDPDTSKEAADHMNKSGAASRAELIVLRSLRNIGGEGTAFQIEIKAKKKHPKIDSNTITPRLKPLERKRLIKRTDRRGAGRGARKQIIWEVTK